MASQAAHQAMAAYQAAATRAQLPAASQTMLTADPAYVRLLEAQSTWPAAYRFSATQPVVLERPILGVNAPHVGPRQVPTENGMVRTLPAHTRVVRRASQNRLVTPLYGRAPYRILQGLAARVDEQSKLRQSHVVPKTGSRYEMAEASYDALEFVTLPRPLMALPEMRLGMLTRVGATYEQPRER